MPPKGWRKNPDGEYPATSKERDSISIDDILFPKATVNKLARAILPENGLISKDSVDAIQRSSTLFVSYLLVHARSHAKKFDRKTIGPQDILSALQTAEFSSFIPSVKQELETFQAHKDAVKQRKKDEKTKAVAPTTTTTKEDGNGNETVDENDTTNENDETPEVEEEAEPIVKKPKTSEGVEEQN